MVVLYPILATTHSKRTSQSLAPGQRRCHGVVGPIPAGILHQCKGDAREDRRLCVRASHGLILQDALFPVGQGGTFATLILQLGALQLIAVKVGAHLGNYARRDHHVHYLVNMATTHRPVLSHHLANGLVAPLMDLQSENGLYGLDGNL